MIRKTPFQRFSALILVATLPALSGTIPVLDLMVGDGKAAVEAEHLPGTHGFPHNHLICIQHQASQWASGCDATPALAPARASLLAIPFADTPIFPGEILLPRARAPPAA